MIRNNTFIELRHYLHILRRRWALIVIPTLIVLGLGVATFNMPQPSYKTELEFIVSQEPSEAEEATEEDRQFIWVTSQYVVNGLTDWMNNTDFAGRIADRLNADGFEDVTYSDVLGSMEAETVRSKITLVIAGGDEEMVEAMAYAAADVLENDNTEILPQLGDQQAIPALNTRIEIETLAPSLTAFLDVPIRVFVAVAAGIGLALLIEYVDPKIQSRYHLREINLPLMGEIPPDSRAG